MTAVRTLHIEPADFVTQNLSKLEVPLSSKEEYRRWRLAAAEREGLVNEPPLSMEEVVAIVKEVRAER